jgi:hypothetical protein
MKTLYIEPRQIGKSLKLKSLYDIYSKKGGCLMLFPTLKMANCIFEFASTPREDIITKEYDFHGRKEKTLLIDEYFFLSKKQKEYIIQNMFLFDNVIAFTSPDKFYPKDLVAILRESKHFTTDYILNDYFSSYPNLYEYKNQIIQYIIDIDVNIITNPDFEIVNTIISKQPNKTLSNKYQNLDLKALGQYLENDEIFWAKYFKKNKSNKFKINKMLWL